MARTKAFNRREVVEKAMHLFWEKGYYATSIQELTQNLGISRSSMYDTFGDKEALFLESLHYYKNNIAQKMIDMVMQGKTVYYTISHLFDTIIEESEQSTIQKGCFIVNSTTEAAIHEPKIRVIVQQYYSELEHAFTELFIRGIATEELNKGFQIQDAAVYYVNQINGLRVIAKAYSDSTYQKKVKKEALHQLGFFR